MPKMRLTQAAADKLSPPQSGRLEIFDAVLPGFGLRISASGARSWQVFYRVAGKQRRFTIATAAQVPQVADARARARAVLAEAAKGRDPAETKAVAKAPPLLVRQPDTVATVCKQFIERYAKPKNKSWAETDRLLQRHVVARWGDRPALSIVRRDVVELLDELVDRGTPVIANRVLAALRKMCNWAVERDILPASPVANVKAPAKEIERERVLSDDELVKIWTAVEKAGGVAGAFFKLLALTGQRREEVAGMRWADIDFKTQTWTLPREMTKGDRSHEVPLAPLAMETIAAIPRVGIYVLSTTRGDKPISGYSKVKARIAALAGFDDWRIHDLRRTAATGMARCRIATSTISRVLNHKEGGVTKIYNRYSYLDEKRHALETWARKVESLVRPAPANVVELKVAS